MANRTSTRSSVSTRPGRPATSTACWRRSTPTSRRSRSSACSTSARATAATAGSRRWFEEVEDLWDGFEIDVEATHEVDGAVIGFLRLVAHTRGRTSDARIAAICRFRDGKILSFRGRDRDELIEELGLPE